jgi:hypothetical protein
MFPPFPVEGAGIQVAVPRVAMRQKPVSWLTCQVPAPVAGFHSVPIEGAGVQRAIPPVATRQKPVLCLTC